MSRIILWGATGQAKVLKECLTSQGIQIVALFENNETIPSPFPDVPIYYGREGFQQWLDTCPYSPGSVSAIVAIGGSRGCDRIEIHRFLESHGIPPQTVIHPTAFVAENAALAPGCQILAQTAICVEAELGASCIINTGATVDHECRLGDGVHIAPGAHLAGCVEVGPYATIYTGAVVIPRIKIGEGAVVGAGAVVTRDVPPYTLVAGNPARIIRSLEAPSAVFAS